MTIPEFITAITILRWWLRRRRPRNSTRFLKPKKVRPKKRHVHGATVFCPICSSDFIRVHFPCNFDLASDEPYFCRCGACGHEWVQQPERETHED